MMMMINVVVVVVMIAGGWDDLDISRIQSLFAEYKHKKILK